MNQELMDQIDEYLSDRMPDEQRDTFEESLLTDSVLQREVKEQMAFRDALRAESRMLLAEPEPGLIDRLRLFILSPAWAYAATTGLVVAIGIGLAPLQQAGDGVMGQSAVLRNVELTRSSEVGIEMSAPVDQAVLLSIDAYGLNADRASLTVYQGDQPIIILPELIADEQELFNVVVGPFEPGQYRVEIARSNQAPVLVNLTID